MGAISLNLATFEYRTKRIGVVSLLLACLAVTMISFFSMHAAFGLRDEIQALEKRVARLEDGQSKSATRAQANAGKPLGQEVMRTIRQEASLVNQLITDDAFPWDRVLDGLEKALPEGVLLSSFHPSPDRKKIMVKGRSRSTESLSRFMSGLDESGVIDRAALTKLHVERGEGHSEAMVFEAEGRLRLGPDF